MPYPHPDTERYGGYDREEALKNAELPPDRDPREEDDDGGDSVHYAGWSKREKEVALEHAELPPDHEPGDEDDGDDD